MPVVIVNWLKIKGREKKKEKLIQGICQAFDNIGLDGNKVHIIINDVPKENWGHNRVQATRW